MEEALRESEERFHLLAEELPVGISLMDSGRRFEYFNARFTEIFGYTLGEIPTKDDWFEKYIPTGNTGKIRPSGSITTTKSPCREMSWTER